MLGTGFKNNALYFEMEDTMVQTMGSEAREIFAVT